MYTCEAHQINLGGPAKWAANGPAWTGSATSGLLYRTLYFPPPTHFFSVKWQTWQFLPIFNELTKPPHCSNKEIQSAIFIHYTTNTHTSTISSCRPNKRDMTQCCFYNWFASSVHSLTVHRNSITANCSSKHEHLIHNDSTSFTLLSISLRTSL